MKVHLCLGVALAIFLALPAALEGARCGPRDDEVTAPWRPLSWDDYRAKLDSRRSSDAATTRVGLVLKNAEVTAAREGDGWVAKVERVCVYAAMYKLESGYTHDNRTERNLAHGQLRFDLTEVFARRLYGRVLAMELEGPEPSALKARLKAEIEKAYTGMRKEWAAAMELHSQQTDYGRRRRGQKMWTRQVQEWLAELPPAP